SASVRSARATVTASDTAHPNTPKARLRRLSMRMFMFPSDAHDDAACRCAPGARCDTNQLIPGMRTDFGELNAGRKMGGDTVPAERIGAVHDDGNRGQIAYGACNGLPMKGFHPVAASAPQAVAPRCGRR